MKTIKPFGPKEEAEPKHYYRGRGADISPSQNMPD